MDSATETSVRAVMAALPTDEEVLIYILVEQGGWNPEEVAERLPIGLSRATAYRVYAEAKRKMERLMIAGVFSTTIKQ